MKLERPKKKIKLIILVGFPGSGKSTWAKKYRDENKDKLIAIINQDTLGKREVCLKYMEDHIKNGWDEIIIDRTNINRRQRKYFIQLAQKLKVKDIQIYLFKIRKELCVKRIMKRTDHPNLNGTLTENRIKSIVRKFVNEFQKPDFDEGVLYIHTIYKRYSTSEKNPDQRFGIA